ncbi:hypothetical protein [Emticicia sp. BO119]|uniref:hypothetical protein n=1 Tax=Emticicia sp. BO119 TaxID=2757768 RepID=UPI0015F10B5B|nr:hypothetical protein [Emticicia sp. BO119]MBA4850818.1 hypothetical protein [Emticicia sp. BO119]
MAIKSFFLSLVLTLFLGYSLTVGLTTKGSFLYKIPDWGGYILLITTGILYILAFWWGIRGFLEHKFLSLISLGLSGFGIACYALFISMEIDRGKPSPRQFEYDLSEIPAQEQAAILSFAKQTRTPESEIRLTEYWKLQNFPLAVCIQKGHVIGVGLTDKPITDISILSSLSELNRLYLKGAHLKDLSDLQLPKLYRLELQNNEFSDLTSFSGIPNVEWLFVQNNKLRTLKGIEQMPKLKEKIFSGNPGLDKNQR